MKDSHGPKDDGREDGEVRHSSHADPDEGDRLLRELERIVSRTIEIGRKAPDASGTLDTDLLTGLDSELDLRGFYREFIEKSNDAMCVVDLFGNLKFVNRKTLQLTGYRREDLLGENISRFLYPEGLRRAVRVIASLMRGRDVRPEQFTVKTPTGDRLAEISVTLVRKGGFPVGVMGVARDITDRVSAEDRLRESEARLQAVIESLPFDLFALDGEGRCILQNSHCRDSWGDVTGRTPAEVAPDRETLEAWLERNRRALEGETVRGEYRRTVDGEERCVLDVVSPVREGSDIKAVLGLSMDITEQRRGEELLRLQRDLASSLAGVEKVEDGLHVCLKAALEASGMEAGGIYLFDQQAEMLELAAYRGLTREYAARVKRYGADSPQAEIVRKGVPSFPALEDLPQAIREVLKREGLKVLAVLPIVGESEALGCVVVSSRTMVEIPHAARKVLEAIASLAGVALTRVRAKERLRESERKYRELVANIPIVSWTADAEGNTVLISPNVLDICGFGAKEIMEGGRRLFYELVHPEDLSATQGAYRALVEDGRPFDIEYRLRHKDGRWIWLRERAYIRENEDEPTHAFGVFYDVTERKVAEEALKESEERYRSLVEQTSELVFTVSEEGLFTFVNRSLEHLSGWSAKELLGRHFSEFFHCSDIPALRERLSRALAGEDVPVGEGRLRLRSGDTRPLEYSVSRLLSGGKTIGVSGVARDVAGRRSVEEDRRHLVALKERENISRWLHDDLGADLYNIILLADSLQRQLPHSSVIQQQIDWITETSRKSLASIRNYLDFSDKTGFTLQGLVNHMREYGESLLKPLGIRFDLEKYGDMQRCSLTGVQAFSVYLIFKESLTNVVKHARASRVDARLLCDEGKLEMTVDDDGRGLKPEPDPSGGFGTSNLRARAAEMGAHLHVETGPGGGTRVEFTLPRERSSGA